ncbi:iron chelate uptake ABC transporter family permease subunit [Streptomyces prasinus]|uniref:iron chelate uptake ABC transporter family permease subunit n=1 Tax=Streptomyces prasinus TaxID=67345 RepID=UPI0006EB2EC5
MYEEVRTVSKIFGVPDRAVSDPRSRVGKTTAAFEGTPEAPVFLYDSSDRTACTGGGTSLGTELMRLRADIAARVVATPGKIPTGVLTALCGGSFLLWLVRRDARRTTDRGGA